MPGPTVSVVMSTYRRRALLPQVLAPLLANDDAAEIVVVVDGSRDGSLELLAELAADEPRLRPRFIENAGKERARQVGVEQAVGDVVLLLDDDVLVAPDLVAGHARHHRERNGLVVVGYMPVRVPSPRRSADAATALYAAEYEGLIAQYERDPGLVLQKLWGGNVSLRRGDALRVGLVSPGYTAKYHQDREFGIRCAAMGLQGRFDRGLRATHLHARSPAAFVRDAQAQGRGRRQLQDLYPAELGPFDDAEFASGLPAPLAAWVRAARRPAVLDGSTQVLLAAAHGLGRAGLWRGQEAALKVLRRMHQQAGATAQQPAEADMPRTR